MTASSIDLCSRQVQLIGLPPQTTASVGVGNVGVGVVMQRVRPTLASVRRVSRNLFGSPKTGEISEMLHKDNQRKLELLRQRYQIDLENIEKATELPSLIAKELQEDEQRLTPEKCNLNRDLLNLSTLSPTANRELALNTNAKIKQIAQIKRTVVHEDSSCGSSERGKPYVRQTLLTDCFNKRKTTTTPANNSTTTPTTTEHDCDASICHSTTLIKTSPSDLEVLELDKPMRATLSLTTSPAVTGASLITSAQTTLTTAKGVTCDVPIVVRNNETKIQTPQA